MTFAQEVWRLSTESLKEEPPTPSEYQKMIEKRSTAIREGTLTDEQYTRLKKEILRDIKDCKLWKIPPSRRCSCSVVYKPDEYNEKKKVHRSKYCNQYAETEHHSVSEVQRSILSYTLPHCVFTHKECEIIKKQLIKLFEKDGLRYTFKIEEFKYRRYQGLICYLKPKEFYGYTIDFTVSW